MARQGITEEQVTEAAAALIQDGQAVTVSAVRDIIGTGSYSTINAHLAKWKAATQAPKHSSIPDMPESVGRSMRQLWASAWNEAQDSIKAEREALEAARRDMERERRDMVTEITRLETANATQDEIITQLTGDLSVKTEALTHATATNHGLQIENARLDERAKAAEGRTAELRAELAELHTRFKELAKPTAATPKDTPTAKPKPSGTRKPT